MKKPYSVCLICLVVTAAMCLAVSWNYQPSDSEVSTGPTITTRPIRPTETSPVHQADFFRLYICEQEDAAAMEQLVEHFLQETGITCQIVTGEPSALLESDEPPTLFCLHSQSQLQQWQAYMLPLGEDWLSLLYRGEFAWYAEEQPVALTMDMEAYGLIYNAKLLARAGFSREDIGDFAALQAYAGHITANYRDMGFYPLCAPDLKDRDLLKRLLCLNQDTDQIRGFLDLYIDNATATGPALAQFPQEKFVFYLGSTGDYPAFSQLGVNNLDMLPAYTPAGGSIHCECSTYWAIHAQSPAWEQEAAEIFWKWMLTPGAESGAAPVSQLEWFAPFRGLSSGNALENKLRGYLDTESVSVHMGEPLNWKSIKLVQLTQCLETYMQNPTDENWKQVLATMN